MQAEPPLEPAPPGEMHPLAQAVVDAHAAIAPKIAAQNTAHIVDLLEGFERDIAPLVAPIAQGLLDDPNTPAELHPFLNVLTGPTHFGESVVIGIAIGSILSPVLATAFEPIVQGIANGAWSNNPSRPLSPDLLAASVLKGVETEGTAASEASKSGISAGAFDVMVKTAGNAIGIESALLLFRRKQIDAARLRQVEQYSNLNPLFYDMVPMLRYVPLSVGEVVTGNLKGHIDDGTAAEYLGHAGIDPVFQPLLKASAGRPLGLQEMLHLWNRQKMTEADVDAGIRQSDINDTYLPFAKELRHYYPPPRSLVPMLRSGAITDAQFTTWMSYYGAEPDVVTAFRKEANAPTSHAGKDLTQAQVSRLYGAEILTRAEATTRLDALGLPAESVTLLLDYEDDLRPEKLMNALIAKIGGRYVAHKMTKPEATTALAAGKVPSAAVQQLFSIWDIERTATTYTPSPSGIVGALRRGLITPAAAHRRLNNLGVLDADIVIVVGDGWPPTAPQDARAAVTAVLADDDELLSTASGTKSPHKTLTPTQITKEYLTGLISRPAAITALETIGYNATDANALLTLAGPPAAPVV